VVTASRRLAALLAGCAVLSLTSACSTLGPSIPTGEPPPVTITYPATPVPPTPIVPHLAKNVPLDKVSAATRQIKAQLGVEVYWHTFGTDAAIETQAAKLMNYVVSLHSNSVGITFPIFTDGDTPTRVYTESGSTPDIPNLQLVIEAAQARGLRVMLRPIIDETNISITPNAWRGSIQPTDMSIWFDYYRTVLEPFLALAQEMQVDGFVVGVELDSLMSQQAGWKQVVATAHQIYAGPVSFSANWDTWVKGTPSVPVPEIGVSAYPQLKLPDDATVAQLTAAWTAWLDHRTPAVLQNTVIQEVGIAAAAGAYSDPAAWAVPGQIVQASIQTSWFTAACRSAKAAHMAGMYFWDVDSNANPALLDPEDAGSFVKRGDAAIKTCFATGWSSS
jgi:hypothetical protein